MTGLRNFRDLGGLPLRDGGVTKSGVFWRSAHPDELDAASWARVRHAGITTIVDLRNADERAAHNGEPDGIRIIHVPLEDPAHPEYTGRWNRNWATPDFYAWGREAWPELWTTVFATIAEAHGGVLIHCAAGRDRTGMITAALLEVAGVERAVILDEYVRGIHESDHRDIDPYVDEYRAALDRLLDGLHAEPELLRAAERLRM